MMQGIEIVGYAAGALAAVSLSPQVIKAWKTKSTKDISILWTLVYLTALILWIIYGIGIKSYPLIVMVSVETALAIFLIFLKIKYK